ncbi:SDR family NAD(P)-dependent oxidoreductase [Clostridium intestinale]|uniref:Dehydrogenase n=1 Tax=Clostridium intestinale URNW TaxID=1294142 RepID=U2NJ16_9CLOT|nr:SDR family NAD(P)-dependent oxidoreductase [Clostridium intestinale]ERK29128.1 dehydrogenase [Clostridium intestinale URNW]
MKRRFLNKSVIIVGASGGLGESFVKAFSENGARLLIAGRNEDRLNSITENLEGDITKAVIDISDKDSVERFSIFADRWAENIDIIVNVSGYDVRKSLNEHEYEEIKNSFDVNTIGAILLTKAFVPFMKDRDESNIVHIGGFVDGRLAFPYYSVDAASRAALFTFIESINREIKVEGGKTRVTFFCPSAADTKAERPYHLLWKKMGTKVVSAEKVAEALMDTIEKKKLVSSMGGLATIGFAKLNSIFPKVADKLLMNKYSEMIKNYLYGSTRRN